jgi:hypothetical protein
MIKGGNMDLQKADSKEYLEFIDKFAPKTTTDDCFTPPLVYDAVRDWVCKEYGVDKDKIVRPFYPGGDYQNFDYSNGAVVVDNPPFSILSKICTHYLDECIPFFLFAPALTCLSGKELAMNVCHVMTGSTITYANGATVETAYVTNLDDPDLVVRTAPDLSYAIKIANETHLKEKKRVLQKNKYPDYVLTAAMANTYASRGVEYKLRKCDCVKISALDEQKEKKKAIFGGGLLLSERAAAERAAAERAAAERWTLSNREWEIVRSLGDGSV